MSNYDPDVRFRCFDTCFYRLEYPLAFLRMKLSTLKKLFKWLFQFSWYEENKEAIDFLDRELPQLGELMQERGKARITEAEQRYKERLNDYRNFYKDPDPAYFPASWTKTQKRKEATARKRRNQELVKYAREAKDALERAQKTTKINVERAKAVYELYQNAKIQHYF